MDIHEQRLQAHNRALKIVQGLRDGSLRNKGERTLADKPIDPMLQKLFDACADDEAVVTLIMTFVGIWLKQYGRNVVLVEIAGKTQVERDTKKVSE